MYLYKLIEKTELAPKVFKFVFSPLDQKLEYLPGQFAFIHVLDENGETIVKRPMSICSNPKDQNLEFCIKLIGGKLTSRLETLELGEKIGISKGGGILAYKGEQKIGLISGGTGIAPMMGIIRSAKNADIAFIHSAKEEVQVLYSEELEELAERTKVIVTLTKDQWNSNKRYIQKTGRINKEFFNEISDVANRTWFVCGPLAMCKAMKDILVELGVDAKNIKLEGWG